MSLIMQANELGLSFHMFAIPLLMLRTLWELPLQRFSCILAKIIFRGFIRALNFSLIVMV